jgi:multidrug efflux pump subunit AcrB
VQNRVSQALGRLPTEVRALGVTVNKQQTGFVMAAGVYSERGSTTRSSSATTSTSTSRTR